MDSASLLLVDASEANPALFSLCSEIFVMTRGLEPTETTDNQITVIVLFDGGADDRIRCTSFDSAIATVKEEVRSATTVKIENRESDIVFTSADMDIEDWENELSRAKRRMSVDVEEYDCPYDNVGCIADDLCIQCKMAKVHGQFSGE